VNPILEFDRVTRDHGGRAPALRDLSFQVEGGVLGVLGNNGVGKSTLLKLAAGLMEPATGHVRIGGHDTRRDATGARRLSAFLPENLTLDDLLTPEEFLRFAARVRECPEDALDPLVDRLGLGPHRSTLFKDLSFGSRRKVGLAAALMAGTRLLILDEPGNGLDVASLQVVEELIAERVAAGATVLLSSHDMAFVTRTCPRVMVLGRDGAVTNGTPATLVADSGQPDLHHAFAALAGADQ